LNLRSKRRLAAEILGVGENRIWIDPEMIDEVSMAATREDIRRLIKEGVIRVKPEKGISRIRVKMRKKRKHKRGPGSKKGKKTARMPRKEAWMARIRAIRKKLRELRDRRLITRSVYRMLYRRAKGGMFKSVRHLMMYIEENNLLRRVRLE